MFCKKLDSNSKFCSNCGFENNVQAEQKNTEKTKKKKKKWLWVILIVSILCFFYLRSNSTYGYDRRIFKLYWC